jgi:hypothetical protein
MASFPLNMRKNVHAFLLVNNILAHNIVNIGIHIDVPANNVETNHIMWPQININIIILMIWPTFYWKKSRSQTGS